MLNGANLPLVTTVPWHSAGTSFPGASCPLNQGGGWNFLEDIICHQTSKGPYKAHEEMHPSQNRHYKSKQLRLVERNINNDLVGLLISCQDQNILVWRYTYFNSSWDRGQDCGMISCLHVDKWGIHYSWLRSGTHPFLSTEPGVISIVLRCVWGDVFIKYMIFLLCLCKYQLNKL